MVTFLCLNIEKANERITDPKNPIRMSPAPGSDDEFVRYDPTHVKRKINKIISKLSHYMDVSV